MFISHVLLEHSYAPLFKYCIWWSWIVATETIAEWPTELKIFTLTLYGESLPTPGLCWNSKAAQLQWRYLMTNTNPSAGTGSWKHHPQPQPHLLTFERMGSNAPWASPRCSLLRLDIDYLPCMFSGLSDVCNWDSFSFYDAESDISIPTTVWKFPPAFWDEPEDQVNNNSCCSKALVWDLSCLSFRCLKTIAAKGKSSIYMYIAKMLLGVMPRLFWDDTRLVLRTTFASANFQWRALNTFFVW